MLFDTKHITQYKYQDSTGQKDKKYGWLSNHQFFFGFSSSTSENIAGFPWAMFRWVGLPEVWLVSISHVHFMESFSEANLTT